jgi:hypothetical protein
MPVDQGREQPLFVPEIFHKERQQAVRFREPTFAILYARASVASFQLATVAGAAVIAKTAVAPLERIKVFFVLLSTRCLANLVARLPGMDGSCVVLLTLLVDVTCNTGT